MNSTKKCSANLFLVLFMGPTAIFGTIHGSYCTISEKKFQFQQNKQIPNEPFVRFA